MMDTQRDAESLRQSAMSITYEKAKVLLELKVHKKSKIQNVKMKYLKC